ncbi:MAG: cytochrome b N-terminal domain-containing protein [Spirochaetales bacterium]
MSDLKYPEDKKLGPQFSSLMIDEVPNYGNRFQYSLGFLAAIAFTMLIVTGVIEVFFGADWWLTNSVGIFFRSIHLWATQAFVVFIILHLVVVFCTMGYRGKRKITWVLGVLMFLFALIETEMGYALRGDFSAQWRALQGADFFNGSGLGLWINPLNELKIMGTHIMIMPLIIITILVVHYMLVRFLGLATPPKPDHPHRIEKANHTVLFLRGGFVAVLVIVLAILLPSPYVKPVTAAEVAKSDPKLFARTLVGEFGRLESLVVPGQAADVKEADLEAQDLTSGYVDNLHPYTDKVDEATKAADPGVPGIAFDTREVFVKQPWSGLVAGGRLTDDLATIEKLSAEEQAKLVEEAADYFGDNKGNVQPANNLLIGVVNNLTTLATSGYYDQYLKGYGNAGDNTKFLRFMADLGVLAPLADAMDITTEKWGFLREEKPTGTDGKPMMDVATPPGAWWLAPIGVLNTTVLVGDDNGDRDGAMILGILVLILGAVPFIPGVNKLPLYLSLYKLFQRKPKAAK